jgi:hypothetical protein
MRVRGRSWPRLVDLMERRRGSRRYEPNASCLHASRMSSGTVGNPQIAVTSSCQPLTRPTVVGIAMRVIGSHASRLAG